MTHGGPHVVRFSRAERILHGLLMTSFLGLALTGLPILFADAPWAARMAGISGGYGVTAVLHRAFGVLLLATFATHVGRVVHRVYAKKETGILWGPDSMVPQPKDARQLVEHVRWFLGRGPRPDFDRFTYWEKFDYWAVFWGMGVIGLSGVMLWFPAFFARFVPGWVFNLAFVVHGEEALLAMVFIFTVHFFNGHLRPEKFPMDTVIFTGRLPEEELREERPAHFARLEESGELAKLRVGPPAPRVRRGGIVIGTVAILLGLTMVVLTVYALFWT